MGAATAAWMDHLELIAVRANSDWVIIRRRSYFDVSLEDDEGPFASVEVLLNESQDKLLVRVWGKTWYTSDKSGMTLKSAVTLKFTRNIICRNDQRLLISRQHYVSLQSYLRYAKRCSRSGPAWEYGTLPANSTTRP